MLRALRVRSESPTHARGVLEMLLIVGILLVILALLGFGGAVAALRRVAWLLLIAAIALIVASFFV